MESEREHDRGAGQAARWSPRLAALALVTAAIAFALGFLDPHGGESVLAAAALAVSFVGAGFGLGGLFTALLARERAVNVTVPRWTLPVALAGIGLCFLAGVLGVVT